MEASWLFFLLFICNYKPCVATSVRFDNLDGIGGDRYECAYHVSIVFLYG